GAADDLAARQRDAAPVHVLMRRRRESPAELGAHDRRADGGRNADERMLLRSAGLDQADTVLPILRQPRREHAAGRSRADDDIVELSAESRIAAQEPPLQLVCRALLDERVRSPRVDAV